MTSVGIVLVSGPMTRRSPVVLTLIALNIVVFVLWRMLPEQFMVEQFSVSWTGLSEGRIWTLLTSEFSHNLLWHLLFNMVVLKSFGSLLESVLGPGRLIGFYLVAALVASLTHGLVSAFIIGEPQIAAVGASGAIAGLVLLFALMFPREKLLLFFVIPLPAMIGAIAFVAFDIWGLVAQVGGGGLPIGHGAHLGGALTGAIYYFVFIRKRWLKIRDKDR